MVAPAWRGVFVFFGDDRQLRVGEAKPGCIRLVLTGLSPPDLPHGRLTALVTVSCLNEAWRGWEKTPEIAGRTESIVPGLPFTVGTKSMIGVTATTYRFSSPATPPSGATKRASASRSGVDCGI